jgi:aldose 1-epimerase
MRFTIQHTIENDLQQVILRDETSGTAIAVLPGFGATLHAFRVRKHDGSNSNVIDNYRDLSELKSEMNRSYKGPKLSPFPCRIPDGKYHFGNKDYQFSHLFSDGTAIHGLLADRPFTVLEEAADDTVAMVFMEYRYKGDDEGYPWNYDCQVRYILYPGSMLEVVTTVTNLDKTTIPIADGWHPYFRLGGKTDDWSMQFHADAIVDFDERLVPTGHLTQYTVFDTARSIGDTFLDNCFTLKQSIVGAICEISNPVTGLRVSFFPDSSYPYLQIYTPATRDSIAIENLSGAPDCFNNKMGLKLVEPGHSQIFTTRYKVSVG